MLHRPSNLYKKARDRLRSARRVVVFGGMATLLAACSLPMTAAADSAMPVDYHAWNSGHDFYKGDFDGTRVKWRHGEAVLTLRKGETSGTWVSNAYKTPVPMSKIVPSWQAETPDGTWIQTDLSVKVDDEWSDWFVMGKWTLGDTIQRATVAGQENDFGAVYQDTYFANDDKPATEYRLRAQLHGDGEHRPRISQLAVTASSPAAVSNTASETTMHRTVDLDVPKFSQYDHEGEYPQYDAGGEAWCNPTSTAMIIAYYGEGPTQEQIDALPADPVFDANGREDGEVDYAAIHTFDFGNGDTGNWPFQTAYAASYGLDASVRQANSLRKLESHIKRGIPLVISTAWDNTDSDPNNDLTGSYIPETAGHLMVVRGFTEDGDVIANDPASADDASVRRVYQRAEFERNWLNVSDGTYYLIRH